MPYLFTTDVQKEFLRVQVTGENSPQTVARYLAEVREACARHHCSSVLIEENLEGPGLGTFDIFALVSEGSKNVWPAVQRIAYVDVNPDHNAASMKFAETVALNRGVNMRVFADVAEAESWLNAEIVRMQKPRPEAT